MTAPTEQAILSALSTLQDPDLNQDIVSLGFIKNLKINGGNVSFDIELTTPACPVKAKFQDDATQLVKRIPGVTAVAVNMTSRPGKNQQADKKGLKDVGAIIAVASCKGGVGKSTVAANIARELASRGFKTGLLDTDLFGPSLPTLFDIYEPEILADQNQMILPLTVNELKLMSLGFLMGDKPAVMRGPMVASYTQQVLTGVKWNELDYLILDMPPGTGDVQLTITQSVRLAGAVIVTTNQALSIVDVAKGIQMFDSVNVPILGIVENMAYFMCDNCDKKHYIFGQNEKNPLRERFGLESLGELPIMQDITARLQENHKNPAISAMVDNMIRALGKQQVQAAHPSFTIEPEATRFVWQDGSECRVRHRDLRFHCPCAVCVDEYTGGRKIQAAEVSPKIAPESIKLLGNYAFQIVWNDGHSSGIYPFKYVRSVGAMMTHI